MTRMTRFFQLLLVACSLAACAAVQYGCQQAHGADLKNGDITVPAASHGDPGSAPVQPIYFKHKLHAGDFKIPCLYCHSYAEKSPVANVPAVSVCMNCHKIVLGQTPDLQKEIAKVVDYYNRGESIPWVSVYRLPDHVWFNHKRHVKAGLQCQTCHGPVEQMDRVYQYSSLKMGWCVGCHRQHLNDAQFPTTMDCLICHH